MQPPHPPMSHPPHLPLSLLQELGFPASNLHISAAPSPGILWAPTPRAEPLLPTPWAKREEEGVTVGAGVTEGAGVTREEGVMVGAGVTEGTWGHPRAWGHRVSRGHLGAGSNGGSRGHQGAGVTRKQGLSPKRTQ